MEDTGGGRRFSARFGERRAGPGEWRGGCGGGGGGGGGAGGGGRGGGGGGGGGGEGGWGGYGGWVGELEVGSWELGGGAASRAAFLRRRLVLGQQDPAAEAESVRRRAAFRHPHRAVLELRNLANRIEH